jgi:hypothetical protein
VHRLYILTNLDQLHHFYFTNTSEPVPHRQFTLNVHISKQYTPAMANAPAPFKLSISNNRLKDLHDRLDLTRFPDELNDVGRARGPPLADLARLVERWKTGYDWRRRETEINRLPQFTQPLTVQGFDVLEVHFVHQKSTVEGAIPLLFVHGCTSASSSLF